MAFSYQKSLTIDHTKCGSSDLTDFPMTFSSTVSHFKTVANGGRVQNSNGYDIGFYSNASLVTKLDWEVEKYVASTGELVAHVRIPTLTHSTDKVIYIGYGDSGISTFQGNVNGTWASKYKCVIHGGDGSTVSGIDSTSNGNNFTNTNGTAIAGKFGAGGIDFNGTNAKLAKSGLVIPTTGSASIWWKVPASAASTPFRATNVSPLRVFDLTSTTTRVWGGWYNASATPNDQRANGGFTLATGTWFHMFCYWTNGGTTATYHNGTQVGTSSSLSATFDTSGLNSVMGYDEANSVYTAGSIDEFRLMNVDAGADWMIAEYNNTSSPSTFYSLTDGVAYVAGQYFPKVF